MIIKYDEVTDSVYFKVSDEKSYESQEIKDGVILDYGKNDEIVAIEILKFKKEQRDINIRMIKVYELFRN